MRTKFYTKTIIGMLVACLIAVHAVPAEAAGIKKLAITKGVSLVKKTFDTVGSAIWNNKGAIAVGTAAVAVATQPDILAQPITHATTAVATETTKVVSSSTIGTAFFIVAMLVIVSGLLCITRHYLKLWHIVPLLVVGLLIFSCAVAEAGTFPAAAFQGAAAVNPVVNIVGWVIIIAITIFVG